MKKLILLSVLSLSLIQCTSSDMGEPVLEKNETTKEKTVNPFERSPEEAIGAVQEFLSQNSGLRGLGEEARSIDKLVRLDQLSGFRSTSEQEDFSSKFYAVQFKDGKGYAVVSKDIRTFPIFAVLDSGKADSKSLNTPEMQRQRVNMLEGFDSEVNSYNVAAEKSRSELRMNTGKPRENRETAIQDFVRSGWKLTRQTDIRLTARWGQTVIKPDLFMNPAGASYADVHERKSYDDYINPYWDALRKTTKSKATAPQVFGCTPVAFGQVMYALRDEKGFRDLKYSSGEPILWDRMSDSSSNNKECNRFLGWITMNCSPFSISGQTMVFNINATKFLRKVIGDNIKSRYDNCIVGDGDFNGYGWSEDKRVAEEFFQYPKCFVIMTASSGALNYVNYHTFVIDGMVEFTKKMKGSGFLGTGLFKKTHNGVRHLYHVNAGWNGVSNGYFLYVQSVNNEFEYTGYNDAMDYRSKVAYLIVRPS